MTATTRSKVRRRRSLRSPSTPDADSALLTEARSLVADRKWRPALDALRIHEATHPGQRETDELLAVAAAYAGKRRLRDGALARLSDTASDAASWEALATAHLAANDCSEADHAARQALEGAAHSPSAWGSLATSFAGLGWFEEAGVCLDRCQENGGMSPLARWQLGRAINRWAMGRSHAPLVGLLGTMLLGNVLLGLAFALTAPLAAREVRIGRLDQRFKSVAEETWRTQHRARIAYGTAVLIVVSVWVYLVIRHQP